MVEGNNGSNFGSNTENLHLVMQLVLVQL